MKTMHTTKAVLFILLIISMNSCLVGPKYSRKDDGLPKSFGTNPLSTDTINNSAWWAKFTNASLDTLINRSLRQNNNVLAALSRLEQAGLSARVAKADLWPQLSYQAGLSRGDFTGSAALPSISNNAFAAGILNWEIDLWGKYRHSGNIANAQFLGSQYALYATRLSVESETARLYFLLLDYRERLSIARETLETRRKYVDIIRQRMMQGVIPEIDLNQAMIQEADAAAAVPVFEQLLLQTQQALAGLQGQYFLDDSLVQGKLLEQMSPQYIPDFLPSDLLKRRPDILEAEQTLMAQYSAAGLAQSMRFPSISLTMAGGLASNDLSNFLTGSPVWSVGAGLAGPLMHFGKNKRRAEIELKKIEALEANYRQLILNAFHEVRNTLGEINSLQKQYEIRKNQEAAAANAALLSVDRYNGGITSYLELLESQRVLFNTEITVVQTRQEMLNAYVKLYKALGGGW